MKYCAVLIPCPGSGAGAKNNSKYFLTTAALVVLYRYKMNTEIETQTEEKAAAIAMSAELVQNCQAINNTLKTADVRAHFATHYANAQLDVFGIMALVRDILRDNQAELPRGIENTELRQIAIASSMFTDEILAEVQLRFAAGGRRYQLQAVKNCLSTYGKTDGTIGKINLTSEEDKPRNSRKPRCKWYRVQGKDE